jgi:CheY-like chemotaxis protein
VEDADIVRKLVSATLASYGYDVLSASSATEVLEIAAQAQHPRLA